MTNVMERTMPASDGTAPTVRIDRRWIDRVLVALGAVVTVVLLTAGGLLTWGSTFAEDYVERELEAQNISFPPAEALTEQRPDLAEYAGEQVTTGEEAEAYASFIAGHIENIAGGATYAELGSVERAASAALSEAQATGASVEEVAALEEELQVVTEQRDSIFRGEMLRGTLLNTYAWSTIGQIAGYAAIAAFVGAAAMFLLVLAGVFHLRKISR